MRIRVVEEKLFKFSELSGNAKDEVKRWYLDGQPTDVFSDMCKEMLSIDFPCSKLDVSYSLCYCQSDFFTICGKLNVESLLEKYREKFSIGERKFLSWAFNEYGSIRDLRPSHRNQYADYSHVLEDILDAMEWDRIRGINYDAIEHFEEFVCDLLESEVEALKADGYYYFHEINDETLDEICEAKDYEFFEDGKIA